MDSTIEEVWIGDSGATVVPLDQWLKSNPQNTLEWIGRKDAVALHGEARKKCGVDLSAIDDPEDPNYTIAIVAKLPEGVDRTALQGLLESAPSKFQVDVQLGNKWLALDGLLSDDGEYVPK